MNRLCLTIGKNLKMDGKVGWHPFWRNGLGGLRQPTLLSLLFSLTLCYVLFSTLELVTTYRPETDNHTDDPMETVMTSLKVSQFKGLRVKRAVRVTIAIPIYSGEEEVVTMTEGTTV